MSYGLANKGHSERCTVVVVGMFLLLQCEGSTLCWFSRWL